MPGETSPAGKPPRPGTPAQRPGAASPELRAGHADRDRTVEALRIAAGDGRLTPEELETRVEAALTAVTLSELTPLTADLPAVSPETGAAVTEVKDVVRIEQKFSPVQRTGRWILPRKLEVATEWCEVTLDFTQAVITQDTLHIDLAMRGKNLTLITRPGIVVDAETLTLEHSRVKHRELPSPETPTTLRIELTGKKSFGRIHIRPPQRTFGQRFLGRPSA